jgi:hypothetical protein
VRPHTGAEPVEASALALLFFVIRSRNEPAASHGTLFSRFRGNKARRDTDDAYYNRTRPFAKTLLWKSEDAANAMGASRDVRNGRRLRGRL